MKDFKDVFENFIDSKSEFLDIPDGSERTVTFLSVAPQTTTFKGKSILCLRYVFDVEGKELKWDRTSRELAKQMCRYEKGDTLKIKREGERNKTKYFIDKLN